MNERIDVQKLLAWSGFAISAFVILALAVP